VGCRQVLFSASTAALAFAFDHLLNVTYALVYGIGKPPGSPVPVQVVDSSDTTSTSCHTVKILPASIAATAAQISTGGISGCTDVVQ
jgi:hypothetical protein